MIAALGERVSRGEAIDEHDARLILDCADLIAVGVAADTVRRRLHGSRTTFVRVFEVHVDAPPAALPPRVSAGEFRIVGRPGSAEAAVSAVRAAAAIAGGAPVTGFSLVDLQSLAPGTSLGAFCAVLRAAGLEAVAELPVDLFDDVGAAVESARAAGLVISRLDRACAFGRGSDRRGLPGPRSPERSRRVPRVRAAAPHDVRSRRRPPGTTT